MDQSMRPDGLVIGNSSRPVSRAHSILGEKPTFSKTILSSPPPVRPDPAYISSSAASQWVSAELDDDDLSVSDGALSLLNSFLDQMLFSFLSSARSTRLPQLRQAIPEVLKPRLGKDAMASADEELREYLGDGDDEELSDFYDGQEPARDFDLEVAWKLARLRCMVYTRLGDLEEEDALEIIEREQLDERGGQPGRFSSRSNNITPAEAIFLTSIIEYLGEQALYYAGVLAQSRASNVHLQPQEGSPETPPAHSRLAKASIIEEIDVRRLGREGPLARIWRNWRRPTWSSQESIPRPLSPSDDDELASLNESPRKRAGTVGSLPLANIDQAIHSPEPAHIPLPMSDNDVNEIEVPGLAREVEDAGIVGPTKNQDEWKAKRPTSMVFLPHEAGQPLTPTSNDMPSNIPHVSPQGPAFGRQRSQSLPTPPQSPQMADEAPRTQKGLIAPVESHNVREEAGSANPTNGDVSAGYAVTQDERSPERRHGLVVNATPALPDTQGSRSPTAKAHLEPSEAEQAAAAPKGIADNLVPRPAVEDRIPLFALTEELTHDTTNFDSTHLPGGQQASMTAPADNAIRETDPEDLALSSEEDEPQPPPRRSKHDSVPPIQVGSSSYTYSTCPSDTCVPTPKHRDSQDAPSDSQSIITMPPRQITPSGMSASPGTASTSTPNRQSTAGNPNDTTKEFPSQLESKAQAELPMNAVRNSLPQPRLGSNAEFELSQRSSHSTASSKLLGYTRDDQGRPLPSTEHEDGDTQRIVPTSSSRVSNDTWHTAVTSTVAAPDMRPGTSGSQQPATRRPLKLRMSSEEKEVVSRSSFESEAKKRSLELLIQGDETLHYTLTPTSARAPEFPETIRQIMAPTQDSGDHGRIPASSNQPFIRHRAQQSVGSMRSTNGLRAHPLTDATQTAAAISAPSASSPRLATSRPGASPSKFRHGQPRDAKVESITSRDLADYLRSTGPESENQLPRALVSMPATSASQRPPTARSDTQQSPSEQSRTPIRVGGQAPLHSADATVTGRSSTTAKSRSSGAFRYQPRDAQVSRNATTSALADFIREGPPRTAGDHRIPRTVAPFRTTMDSDDLNGLMSLTDKDRPGRNSAASTQDSSTVSKSLQSSVNSHTALLERSKKTNQGASTNGMRTGTSRISSSSPSTAKDAMPKRKQRRVRDPYAIDDSDDDIEEVATLKSKRGEESLIDFLRNTAPQPSMTAQPIVATNSSAALKQGLQKKNSSSAIRDRIRNTTIPGLNRKNSETATDPPAYSRGSAARAESPHLSQTGSKLDSYKPTQPTHAAYVDRVRSSRTNGVAGESAEHLPNTDQSRTARMTNATKDESGFRAFFSRRKSVKQ